MKTSDSSNSGYGKMHKLLHWLLAINIGATLVFSAGMASLTDTQKEIEFGNHAFSVTTIFLLMLIRAVWRLLNPAPAMPNSMPDSQKKIASMMHLALYVLIFLQIGVGALLASTTVVAFSAAPYGINYTAWALVADDNHEWLLAVHDVGAILIASFVVVHILAALKHHFIDKDNVLLRMLPFVKSNRPEKLNSN